MDIGVDHYSVLGLPSGEEGSKLSKKDIVKAYRSKALELHPDKRPDDPNAHANFQKLKDSYEFLKNEEARKLFDEKVRKLFNDLLVKRKKIHRQSQQDSKRRKMMSDLKERERAFFKPDASVIAREEEQRIARKLKEEIVRIRAMHGNKGFATKESTDAGTEGSGIDRKKALKVSWEKIGEDYTAQRLTELFSEFGKVEDVIIKISKKKGSALVVMSSKDAAEAACRNVLGDLSNPLLIVPLQSVRSTIPSPFSSADRKGEPEGPSSTNLVGAGYQAFEHFVLEKMKKGATIFC